MPPGASTATWTAKSETFVEGGALEWRTVLDPKKLPGYLEEVREG